MGDDASRPFVVLSRPRGGAAWTIGSGYDSDPDPDLDPPPSSHLDPDALARVDRPALDCRGGQPLGVELFYPVELSQPLHLGEEEEEVKGNGEMERIKGGTVGRRGEESRMERLEIGWPSERGIILEIYETL